MGNRFEGTGNLGADPTLKSVPVDGETRKVCELRIFFADYRQDEAGGYEQSGGFWLDVNIWREGLAETCLNLLRKGTRVAVVGRLVHNTWTDKDGEERSAFRLIAESLTLALGRIESVRFRPKRAGEADAEEAAGELAAA